MEELRCPHCGTTPEETLAEGDISDWYYNRNLFTPDEVITVECPRCLHNFKVRTYTMIGYEVAED